MIESADMVISGGNIFTMDERNHSCEALAIKGDRIVYLGSFSGAKAYIGGGTKYIDLNGKTMFPSFIDNSVNLLNFGLDTISIDLGNEKSIEQVLKKLLSETNLHSSDEVIHGVCLGDLEDTESKMLTRWDIDKAFREQMVCIKRIDTHTIIVNTPLLHKLNLLSTLDGIHKNENGIPDGILIGTAAAVAMNKILTFISDQSRYQCVTNVVQVAMKNGITRMAAFEGGFLSSDLNAEYLYKNLNRFLIDIELFYQTDDVSKVVRMGLPQVGSVFLDGTISSRTAAVSIPYQDSPHNFGTLYYSQEEVNEIIYNAQRAGIQISLHAIGDRAIDQALNAFEYVENKCGGKLNWHRIEHCVMMTKEQMDRAARLRIVLSVQPNYQMLFGKNEGVYEQRLGKDRAMECNPLRDMLDRDILVVGGSDANITPISPLMGIHAAVNHPNPSQRISIEEALSLYTVNGAKGFITDHAYGCLQKGNLANMTLLTENPFQTDPSDINKISVCATIKNGTTIYLKL